MTQPAPTDSSEVFFETPFATVRWDGADHILVLEWTGYATGEQYRDTLDEALVHAVQRQATRWLVELRGGVLLNPREQSWIKNDWLPRARQVGVLRFAVVVPEASFVSDMIQQLQLQVEQSGSTVPEAAAVFEDVESARTWLRD